jgi:hypothetical protein
MFYLLESHQNLAEEYEENVKTSSVQLTVQLTSKLSNSKIQA